MLGFGLNFSVVRNAFAVAAAPTEFLLMETGDYILMENGDRIGLE